MTNRIYACALAYVCFVFRLDVVYLRLGFLVRKLNQKYVNQKKNNKLKIVNTIKVLLCKKKSKLI